MQWKNKKRKKTRLIKGYYLIPLIFLYALTISCEWEVTYNSFEDLKDNIWHKDSTLRFEVEPPDTTDTYEIAIIVRNNNEYSYSNLFMLVEAEVEGIHKSKDTLEYEMADPNGKWLGEGITDVKESLLLYKNSFKFSEILPHHFRIKHGMREENLNGISNVGLLIKKIK